MTPPKHSPRPVLLTETAFSMVRNGFKSALIALLLVLIPLAAHAEAPNGAVSSLKKEAASRPAGFSTALQVTEGILEHLRTIRIPLPVDAPGCYRVTVAAESTVEDLSLVLYQAGEEKAKDRLSGKRPSIDWCAAEGGRVEAEVMMYSGRGAFALALFRKEGARPQGTAQLKAGGGDKDFLANRIRQLQSHFAAGRQPLSGMLRGSVDKGGTRSFPIKLRGKCVTVIAAQAPSLLKLDISLSAPGGPVAASLRPTASFTTLETKPSCPKAGTYTLSVRAAQGNGDFAVQVFSD